MTVHELVSVPPPAAAFHLLMAGAKGDRLDWGVEKCTELGTTNIHLVNFARSVVRVGPAHVTRLSRTAIEACKQCHRPWLPVLAAHDTLPGALSALGPVPVLVADPDPGNVMLGRWLLGEPGYFPTSGTLAGGVAGALAVVVGPEGGLTDEEKQALQQHAAALVRLGQHVLRVETAAVAAAATWASCHPVEPPAGTKL